VQAVCGRRRAERASESEWRARRASEASGRPEGRRACWERRARCAQAVCGRRRTEKRELMHPKPRKSKLEDQASEATTEAT
jgi:hypothetical protein